jgi:hypothetical protein
VASCAGVISLLVDSAMPSIRSSKLVQYQRNNTRGNRAQDLHLLSMSSFTFCRPAVANADRISLRRAEDFVSAMMNR